MKQKENKYNLEERTAKFGEEIITLCKGVKPDNINKPVINQLQGTLYTRQYVHCWSRSALAFLAAAGLK